MNKKNLWFLTLFSLVLVLSIYYVTMPSDLQALAQDNLLSQEEDNVVSEISESDAIAALKVEETSRVNDTLDGLQEKLTDQSASLEERNQVYEEIQSIHTNRGIEEGIEKKLKNTYQCESFAKISDTSVKVVVDGCENSKTLANNIMRLVQEEFDHKMYVSVQFQS